MSPTPLPDENPAHTEKRRVLLEAEVELVRQRERVAELRRALPDGPASPDHWMFEAGPGDLAADEPTRRVALADLFESGHDTLVLIQFMYGGAQKQPCPMCSMWADGYDAVARHVRRRASFGVVAEAPLADLRAWARVRGWSRLRLLSSAGSDFKRSLGMADDSGAQFPGVSVFRRDAEGEVRHFYTGGAQLMDGVWRGVDAMSPVWNLLDLTPEGRGDWMPSLEYPDG